MRKLIGLLFLLLLIGGAVILYLWNKPHRDPTGEKAAYSLNATALQETFSSDAAAAQEMYIDQVVQVDGEITEAGDAHIVLDNAVYVRFAEDAGAFPKKGSLRVKGRVVSYDELFEQVRLDFATLAP